MSSRILSILLMAMVSLSIACGGGSEAAKPDFDFQLESQTDPKTNFDGIKTFAWLAAAGAVNDPAGKWSPPDVDFQNELQFLIERELRAKGLNVAAENPDVQIVYLVAVDMEALKMVKERHGETETETLTNTPQGAVIVQMIDSETGKALWTAGIAADVKESPTAEESRKRLDMAVKELFTTYPKK